MHLTRPVLVLLGSLLFLGLVAQTNAPSSRQVSQRPNPIWDTRSDTWAATDDLGRKLPGFDEVGPPRSDRKVGVFYFLWLGTFSGGPYDVTQILKSDPAAMSKGQSPPWGPLTAAHHWGESLFGYYVSDDEYVIRKHAQMLSDAGVDVIIFDVSNGFTYKAQYMKLLEVFSAIRAEGGKTPQIAFLCPFWEPGRVVHELYEDLYGPGLYKDLWFQWKGKPLIMADPEHIGEHGPGSARGTPWDLDAGKTLGESFVAPRAFESVSAQVCTYSKNGTGMTLSLFRQGPNGQRMSTQKYEDIPDNGWMKLNLKKPLPPGKYYLEMSNPKGHLGWWSNNGSPKYDGHIVVNGRPEIGTLYLDLSTLTPTGQKYEDVFSFRAPQPSYFEGPTKPNMWSWLEVYPQHVFRSSDGRKEQMSVGVAQNAVGDRLGSMSEPLAKGRNWHGGANDERPGSVNLGLNFQEQFEHALKQDPEFVFITGWNEWIAGRFSEFAGVKAPVMFVDEFNEEYSRDIEPMKGGHGDDYYYQMVSFIRRFKGVRRPDPPSGPKTIDLDGNLSQWNDVQPSYRDDIGDSAHRDHQSWDPAIRLLNNTGRNDFVLMKVARDKENITFYARTKDPITPFTDPHWMMLFLSVGTSPNWQGYQYVVNRTTPDAAMATLEKSTGGWNWTQQAKIHYRVVGNEMQLSIPRSALGISDASKPIHLEFKWVDNMQHEGEVTDFDLYGDAAPGGRFNYVFSSIN